MEHHGNGQAQAEPRTPSPVALSHRQIMEALSGLMPAERVGPWLAEPNEAFDGQAPMHLVERGEADRLWEMIHQVEANVAN